VHLLLVGLNHETAPLSVRERVAFGPKRALSALERLKEAGIPEVALLSTCNRTELYAFLPTPDLSPLVAFLEETAAAPNLSSHLYTWDGPEAARHLMRVASGLDSMIVGEGQILSQVKTALQQATEAGTLGGQLSSLFRHALAAGKRARTETGIARGAVSISNAAVHLATELFGNLRNHAALVLGAGETAELTLRLLKEAGVHSVVVANRTYPNALTLAEALGGRAVRFDEMEAAMAESDIVISSTASPHALVKSELVARVMRKRRNRPLFLIDIAVPRDIEPAVGDLENVFLYNIDDLKQVVDENLESRSSEAAQVEAIIEEELARFLAGLHSLAMGPLLNALQERFEEIRLAELEKSGRRLSGLSDTERETVELLTRGILKRILKEPISQLKGRADSSEGALYLDALRILFGLPEDLGRPVLPLSGEERRAKSEGREAWGIGDGDEESAGEKPVLRPSPFAFRSSEKEP
jgi:glutamyl-tRNA reductase